MYIKTCNILCSVISVLIITGCHQNEIKIPESSYADVNEITSFEKLKQNETHLLGFPIRLKYDVSTRQLFVQDVANWSVIQMDDSGELVNTFGRQGRGPGEIQQLTDFFITKNHLFIVDTVQYLIHKYNRRDGQHVSSLDYGNLLSKSKDISGSNVMLLPQPPFMDNNNQPFVMLNETILLPSHANGKFLYQAVNWEGDKLADIGEIPTGCTATDDNDKIRSALENREVPARDSCLVFPVNDHSNPDEIYLVYSAIPSIAKYNLSGKKSWHQTISNTPEVDSLMIDLSNIFNRKNSDSFLMPVRKYVAGRSGPDGDLYLVTFTNLHTPVYLRPMWIHRFDSNGDLITRFKLVSADKDLYYFPAIDSEGKRIFTSAFNSAEV